jgi:hypothetical protein
MVESKMSGSSSSFGSGTTNLKATYKVLEAIKLVDDAQQLQLEERAKEEE